MAKSKATEWLEKDKLTLLSAWARDGLTDEQIAHNIGIQRQTIYDWKKKYPDINDALKKGKQVVDIEVENALLKRALGFRYEVKEQKLDKDGEIHTLVKEVYVAPDTTAQIFWLKNRKPTEWRDKQEIKQDFTEVNKGIANIVTLLNNPVKTRKEEDIEDE